MTHRSWIEEPHSTVSDEDSYDTPEYVARDGIYWERLRDRFSVAQGHKCPICDRGLDGRERHLDHCHVSGFIRGTLCGSCNTKLGWYENKRHAIDAYLARAGEFQAYKLGQPRKQHVLVEPRPAKYHGAPDWVKAYWQEKAKQILDNPAPTLTHAT